MAFLKFKELEPMIDYTIASKYYKDPEKSIKSDIDRIEEAKDYISWIQSFSKKIVTITFVLYVIVTIVIMILVAMQTTMGGGDINTIYTEINETFRIVIGGYLIKAGVENTFKIGGNYLVGVSDAKLRVLKEQLGIENDEQDTSSEEEYEEDEDVEEPSEDEV